MINKMQDTGTVVVNEILLGLEAYQRQVGENKLYKPIWFIAECTANKDSWVLLGKEATAALEARYQESFYPAPAPISDEELEDALCEQMASDDYEASVYA